MGRICLPTTRTRSMGALQSIPLCARAKEEEVNKEGKGEGEPEAIVGQPTASLGLPCKEEMSTKSEEVSGETPEKFNITFVEKEDEADREVAFNEESSDQEEVDLDRNHGFDVSGENIDLGHVEDGINQPMEDPHEEENSALDDKVEVSKNKKVAKTDMDTATVITNMLSELASDCDSREVILGR